MPFNLPPFTKLTTAEQHQILSKIGHEMWKLRVEIRLRRSAKGKRYYVDCHETQGVFDNSLLKNSYIYSKFHDIPRKV
jgi:hypothetical protein